MAILQLPVAAYILDFAQQAFPTLDFSTGSALSDTVVKAFGGLMQPFRMEIDTVKINQSVTNWQYMRSTDLDAIAANWGKFRQTGGLSTGTVRIVFSSAQNYQFNTLSFYSTDGTQFVLSAPVTISASQLFGNQLSNGTFFWDVTVQSVGVGSRYALPANSIVGMLNKPAGVISVSNPADFAVTAPNESNFDVLNSMYKNLGMRNLVSRQSIRAPILDNFPGVIDLYIAGAGDPNMLRDLQTVQLPTGPVQLHLGGMTDVWLNTTSLSNQTALISYVPSSLTIDIVSAQQAAADALIFAFTQGQYSVDGVFSNPDVSTLDADESTSIQFDVSDVTLAASVIGLVGTDSAELSVNDVLSSTQMLVCTGPTGYSPFVGDLTNLNFANTAVAPGNVVLLNNSYYRINQVSGRLLDLAPTINIIQDYLYVGAVLPPGTLQIPLPNIQTLGKINDRLKIVSSTAAGEYTVLGIATNLVTIGQIQASGLATFVSRVGIVNTYTLTGPTGGQPLIPPNVGTTSYLYQAADAGYGIFANQYPILSITPGSGSTQITVSDPSNTGSHGSAFAASIIQGLTGSLPSGTTCTLQRDNGQLFSSANIQPYASGWSRHANVTPIDTPAGTTYLQSLGIGANCGIGDLVSFVGLSVPTANIPATGGDGSVVTVSITALTSMNAVTFQPPLPFDIPAGTAFSVIKNNVAIASPTVASVNVPSSQFTLSSMPLGLGTAVGLFMTDPSGNQYTVIAASSGNSTTLQFNAPQEALTLTFDTVGYTPASPSDVGKPVQQLAGVTSNGVLYSYNNGGANPTWLVIPNTPSDTFLDTTAVNTTIIGGTGAGQLSTGATGPTAVGYVPAVSGDLLALVRQGSYVGTLVSYNNTTYQWQVEPLTDSDLFDSLTAITFVDYAGNGLPDPGHGQGTLLAPAGAPTIGSGPVIITLNAAPAFVATNTVNFFSRFGRNGGMFDGSNFTVSTNGGINVTPWAGLVPGTQQLVVLAGQNAGVYDVSTVINAYSLFLTESMTVDFVALPSAPAAAPIVNGSLLPTGTTIFSQSGVGIWGAPGRCIAIVQPSGTFLFPIASINNANSVNLEAPGLTFPIYPNSGFTWQVVEALNTPYWVVSESSFTPYRIFQTPVLGDLLQTSSTGGFIDSSGLTNIFTDNSVNFATLFVNADFSTGDYLLYLDSGNAATSVPFVIQAVTGANAIRLASANWSDTETGLSYRIVRVNGGLANERWIEASVVSMSDPKTQLQLRLPSARTLTFALAEYVPAATTDVGLPVVQTAAINSNGILFSFNNTTRTWLVIPDTSNDTFADTTAVNVAVVDGSGVGQLSSAASAPAIAPFDFMRYGSRVAFDITIVPHPAWVVPGGWTYGANWTMPKLTGSYNPSTQVITVDATTGHSSPTIGDAFSIANGFRLIAGSLVRVSIRMQDRASAITATGSAINTYNYYADNFFQLPVVLITDVQVLDPTSLQPIRSVDYTLQVNDAGLRYSANENNSIVINDDTVALQPLLISYISDSTVEVVNSYLNAVDTKVLNANQLAKRMETVSVDVTISVTTTLTANQVASQIASFVNSRRSTQTLSKADIIKDLFSNPNISYIQVATFTLNATYYQQDGNLTVYTNVDEVYGAPTAMYLSNNISVTTLGPGNT